MPEFKTQRLLLRAPKREDADRMQQILEDYEVARNLSRVPHPYPDGGAAEYIERISGDEVEIYDQKFSIIDGDGRFCGMTGYSIQEGVPQIGYYLDREHWGKGYMTEACVAALKWLFSVSEPSFVKSGVFDTNAGSLAIQNKLGFTEVGRSTVYCLAQNQDLPHIDTRLTKDAFFAATVLL